ncbi:3-oxoacid CoA-transferase [Pseudovirgaria hyperparasitica]|uniref:Succinyl-CoA:3-ketoacid-coenzyme A transferase n=1 Tax=Pseudovirgaria hyperparasitica TaxID=470096 RepID=A0A6A6W630_9PEZI|nr:3-oxoacid CoA-transferase [Pseudovirgaria hyperparasitica]KAF2757484.1 3-oxoacid CoA-transferase [Pseudovirgaria hyperparasitica]
MKSLLQPHTLLVSFIPRTFAARSSLTVHLTSFPSSRNYTQTTQRQFIQIESVANAPSIDRSASKLFDSANAAVADIKSGSTILSAGFGLCGVAETIIHAIRDRGVESLHSLTAVSNNAGIEGLGGLSLITKTGQVDKMILSFLGNNKALEKKFLTGHISIELCPQGTLAERIRAAGAGIPAFYTPTAVNTLVEEGRIPSQFDENGKVVAYGTPRETREFDGRKFLLEKALPGDVAILRAWKVDKAGNCNFRYTTRSYGQIMAKAAKVTIVEAENIVEIGELDSNEIDLPGIYVDRIVPATSPKHIEIRKTRPTKAPESSHQQPPVREKPAKSDEHAERRVRIARRCAEELKQGFYVNLGVGLPTQAPAYLPEDRQVWLQSENGILGMGPYPHEDEVDPDIVNAGKETVTLVPGASTFDSAESFGMIRGGHVDVSILGALQVDARGNLANYMIPGKTVKGMGGAMDLVSSPGHTKVVIATEHVAKDGSPKIVQDCKLPLTGARCASTIITDMCVFEVDRTSEQGGLTLTELAPDTSVEDVRAKTGAEFKVAKDVKRMK